MKQVPPKCILLHEVFQIAMCGHDNPNIYTDRLVATDALDFTFLQHTKQFRLHRDGHVTNLVQEQCAAVSLFEFS